MLGYLNSIPDVEFLPEILNQSMFYGLRLRLISKKTVLRHIAHSLNACRHKICGTKLLAYHLNDHRLSLENLKENFPNVRFIFLYRKSILEQFVSLKIAETTNVWQRTNGDSAGEAVSPFYLETEELRAYCHFIKSFFETLFAKEWLKSCSVVLSYEELVEDAQRVFDEKIFPFLGIGSSVVSSRYLKQNTRPIRETVKNLEEIKDMKEIFQEHFLSWSAIAS